MSSDDRAIYKSSAAAHSRPAFAFVEFRREDDAEEAYYDMSVSPSNPEDPLTAQAWTFHRRAPPCCPVGQATPERRVEARRVRLIHETKVRADFTERLNRLDANTAVTTDATLVVTETTVETMTVAVRLPLVAVPLLPGGTVTPGTSVMLLGMIATVATATMTSAARSLLAVTAMSAMPPVMLLATRGTRRPA